MTDTEPLLLQLTVVAKILVDGKSNSNLLRASPSYGSGMDMAVCKTGGKCVCWVGMKWEDISRSKTKYDWDPSIFEP